MNTQEKSIDKLKSRLQFLIVIALFFPVILNSLYKVANNPLGSDLITISWGTIIAILILTYLTLETTTHLIHRKVFNTVNIAIFINLASYAFVFIVLSEIVGNETLPIFLSSFFVLILEIIIWIPVFIFIVLLINVAIPRFKPHK